MHLVGLLLSLCFFPATGQLLSLFSAASAPVHKFCQNFLSGTAHESINRALLCGAELHEPELHLLLVEVGLYHLVVVSGAHLTFLERSFRRLLPVRAHALLPLFLGFYALVSGWQPPVVRAWIQCGLGTSARSSPADVLKSWIWCLALHPQWIHSLSLHLSVVACLILTVSWRSSPLTLGFRMFLGLFPLLAGWSPLHPLISLIAVALAPVSLALWFATLGFELLNPSGFELWNGLLAAWESVLREVSRFQPPFEKNNLGQARTAWLYALILGCAFHFIGVRRRRREAK